MQVRNFTKKRLTESQAKVLSEIYSDRYVNVAPEPKIKSKSKASWVYEAVTCLNEGDVIVVDNECDTILFMMLADTIVKMFENIGIVQFYPPKGDNTRETFQTHQLWRVQLYKKK